MTNYEAMMTIAIIAIVTLLIRWLPFLLFPANQATPLFIYRLAKVLPYAIIGMLVIYCFKAINFFVFPYALPEILAGLFVFVVHKWKHNLLLSIGGGTLFYMILVQTIFL